MFYEKKISGIIESIRYGDKSQAIVKINNSEFSLFLFNIRKGEDLNKGDSLFKGKKSKVLELHSLSSSGKYIFTETYEMK
ncbi:hypothetical protein [Lutibacter citreus]|uniref:hypothetical protein n=1 Tax=Lutibacter citreus TaxID=2138210 RepID=UPI000DBE2A5D|nr:hypothetical protein [Lutibacter citreus]